VREYLVEYLYVAQQLFAVTKIQCLPEHIPVDDAIALLRNLFGYFYLPSRKKAMKITIDLNFRT